MQCVKLTTGWYQKYRKNSHESIWKRQKNPIDKWVKNTDRPFTAGGEALGRNGSKTYEKTFSLISSVENANSDHNEIAFHTHQMGRLL